MKWAKATLLLLTLLAFSNYGAAGQQPEVVLQMGHSDAVRSIALSANGKYLLSGSRDRTLKLWEVATGRLLRTFEGHSDGVESVTFSPDERFALSGGYDNTMKLWQVENGQLVRTFEGHTESVLSVAFSPDGRYVLSGSWDSTVRLWDVETGRGVRTFLGHTSGVLTVAFSPDGRYMLSGGDWGKVHLWEVATGRLIRTLEEKAGEIHSVVFSPDGRYALIAWDQVVNLHEVATGNFVNVVGDGGGLFVESVAFSPDGQYALGGDNSGFVQLWEVNGEKEVLMEGHTSGVTSVVFTPDGKYALAGSNSPTIRMWEVDTGRLVRSFDGNGASAINTLAISLRQQFLLSGGDDNRVRLWDLQNGRLARTLTMQTTYGVESVAFSPNGQYALVAGEKDPKLWELATGRLVDNFGEQSHSSNTGAISRDGKYVLVGNSDGTLQLWQLRSGRLLRTFEGHSAIIASVAFSPDGRYAVSGSWDKLVKLWEVGSGREIRTFEGHSEEVSSVAFSPDGRHVLSGSWDNTLKLWEVASGRLLYTIEGHAGRVRSVAFSPDGRYVLSGADDNTLKLWDSATGHEVRIYEGHTGWVWTVALSSDGRFILSGSRDGTLRLWDSHEHIERAILIAFGDADWLVVTPDGRFDGSPEGMAQLHYVQGMKTFTLAETADPNYTPGLLTQIFNEELLSQPHVEWLLPASTRTETNHAVTSVRARITSDTELTDAKLLLNGTPIAGLRGMKRIVKEDDYAWIIEHEVTLEPGENEIAFFAENRHAAVTSETHLVVYAPENWMKPNLYMTAIGISAYPDSELRLEYADDDARAISRVLQGQRGKLYNRIYHRQLIDEDATRDSILAVLEWMEANVTHKDVAMVFIAAHGLNDSRNNYFVLPVDGHPDRLRRTAVDWYDFVDILGNMPAKVLLFLDTCHSGQLGTNLTRLRGSVNNTEAIKELASDENGVVVLAASTGNESSQEHPAWGHGAFTQALIEGLEQGRADYSGDGIVHLRELDYYVAERVKELTRGQQHPTTKKPSTISRFPIVQVH